MDHKSFLGIIDSIRNVRVLHSCQQEFVETLDKEECYELLREYNKIIEYVIDYIMLEEEIKNIK